MKEEKEFYSIGRGSLNLNGKFYYGLDYAITDFMRSLEEENKCLQFQLKEKEEVIKEAREYIRSNNIEVLKYHDIPSETASYEIVTVDLLKILSKGENK